LSTTFFRGNPYAQEMSVDAVLERLRQAYAAPDLSGLAECLGMDETTFRVWRTRKTVPNKILVKVSTETGRSVSWLSEALLTAEDTTVKESPAVFFEKTEKQINLSKEEQALIDNFRAANAEGRLALTAASVALAKPVPVTRSQKSERKTA
jgi:hypothetical protein